VAIRVEHRTQYTVIDSRTINDEALSLRSKGLLVWLLDKPDGWRVNSVEISKQCKEGRDAVRTALAELEEAGYLTREKYRGADGRWVTGSVIRERPLAESDTDFADSDIDRGLETRRRLSEDWKPDDGKSGALISTKSQDYKKTIKTYVNETENAETEAVSLPPRSELQLVDAGQITKNSGTAERVMQAWVAATGRAPGKVKLNAKRRAAVAARLREGYTEEDLIAAARGIALSAWHTGDNPDGKKFDDLLVAIRDGERVERFRDIFEAGGERGRMSSTDQVMALYAQEQA
jgi:predicted ArsR family transcriptional regulator